MSPCRAHAFPTASCGVGTASGASAKKARMWRWPRSTSEFERQYPGMKQVCLFHSRDEEEGWRGGGTPNCCCEAVSDARERIRTEIELAHRDEEKAAARVRSLEREFVALAARG